MPVDFSTGIFFVDRQCINFYAGFSILLGDVMKPLKACASMLVLCSALFSVNIAVAVELAGVKLDDNVKVGNQDLKLNGAGLRTKVVFKVYAIGLYLPEKKTAVDSVLASPGARRVSITMLRDVGSEEFGKAFTTGIENNADSAERAALAAPMAKFSAMFAATPELKRGDVLYLDWLPGTGMEVLLNGRKISETIVDAAFYNAVLRIWLGVKPVDEQLKRQLLGQQ